MCGRPQRPPSSVEETYRAYARSPRKRRQWAADNPGNIAIRDALLSRTLELAGARLSGEGQLLDVGCGNGWLLAELAGTGLRPRRLHGVDLIPERVDAATARLPEAEIHRADARSLPFEDGRFELVMLFTCLSSMPPEAVGPALREARRVLSPTGLVLSYEPWLGNPFNRSTTRVPMGALEASLGSATASVKLTGFPPLARRLGNQTSRLYPLLARVAPTHRLTAHEPGAALRPRG